MKQTSLCSCASTQKRHMKRKSGRLCRWLHVFGWYITGGYLDTDVELHKSLDEYLKYDGFFAFESARAINTGLAFGAEQGNRIVGAILKDYMDKPFYKDF